MGSLGLPEIIFIMVIALLIFGPKRLPEIGRTLGKGMAEFRKATNDLKNTISTELSLEDDQPARPRRVDMASIAPVVTAPAPRALPAETVAQGAQAQEEPFVAAADLAELAEPAQAPGSTGPVAVSAAGSPAPLPAVPVADPVEPS